MKRPKLNIALMPIDWILELCGAMLLALNWYYPLAEYGNLPTEVPVHFDFWGNPNIYDDKEIIWTIPILITVLYIGMALVFKIPHLLTYPTKITKTNAALLYSINLRMLRIVRVLIAGEFLFLTLSKISIALGDSSKIFTYNMPIFLSLLALTIIFSMVLMILKKEPMLQDL